MVQQTDILIGMHGAALAYALLLPPHAALVELWPQVCAGMLLVAMFTWAAICPCSPPAYVPLLCFCACRPTASGAATRTLRSGRARCIGG